MTFLKHSRYSGLETVEARTSSGSRVQAVKLRRPPRPDAEPNVVVAHDRVDLLALWRYSDGTRAWHIADANSELEARALSGVPGRMIRMPKE